MQMLSHTKVSLLINWKLQSEQFWPPVTFTVVAIFQPGHEFYFQPYFQSLKFKVQYLVDCSLEYPVGVVLVVVVEARGERV